MLLPITNLLLPFLLTPTTTIPQFPSTYDSFSSKYDVLDGGSATEVLGINAMRAKAASFVKGNVLEVAVGTGLESTFYDWKQISRFTGVDNSEGMLSLANQRIPALAKKTKVDLRLVDVTKGLDFSNDEVLPFILSCSSSIMQICDPFHTCFVSYVSLIPWSIHSPCVLSKIL